MKEIKNILKGSDGYIYLILSDGTTKRTDAARLEPIAADDDWNEISETAKKSAEEINKTLEYLCELSRRMSRKCWYMIEYGNGYTEESAAAYNFFAMLEHAGRPATLPAYVEQWARRIYPIEAKHASEAIKEEAERRERKSTFFDAVYKIFENCLTFNIDLQIDNEKPGGIAEQEARKLLEKIGGYNNFSPKIFYKIIAYLNKYFLCDYGAGNCNNGKKNYQIKFGREGSPVMYIRITAKSEDEINATIDELSELSAADEISAEHYPSFAGVGATVRLWWD